MFRTQKKTKSVVGRVSKEYRFWFGYESVGVLLYSSSTPASRHSETVWATSVMALSGATSYSSHRVLQRAETSKEPFSRDKRSACCQRKAAVSLKVIILLKLMSSIVSPTSMYSMPNLRNLKPSIVFIFKKKY